MSGWILQPLSILSPCPPLRPTHWDHLGESDTDLALQDLTDLDEHGGVRRVVVAFMIPQPGKGQAVTPTPTDHGSGGSHCSLWAWALKRPWEPQGQTQATPICLPST